MTIIRTPRPLEPDTRRAVLDGHLGPADLDAPTVGRRRLENIRARVATARLVVQARNNPGWRTVAVDFRAFLSANSAHTEWARLIGDVHPESRTVYCATGLIDRRVPYSMLWLVTQ